MPANDVFGLPTVTLSKFGTISIDLISSERHRFDNLVTSHPLEDGSPVTDHIVNQPVVLDIEGRVTDTPISFAASLGSGAAGLLGSSIGLDPTLVAGATAAIGATLPGRSKQFYQELVALYASRETFTYISGINEYQNMTFASLEFPRDKTDGRSLRFKAQLIELIIIGVLAQTNAARVAEEVQNTALEPNNRGTLPNQAAT